jgi:hypothetical protein
MPVEHLPDDAVGRAVVGDVGQQLLLAGAGRALGRLAGDADRDRALAGERRDGRGADPGRRAGHDDDLAGQVEIHGTPAAAASFRVTMPCSSWSAASDGVPGAAV